MLYILLFIYMLVFPIITITLLYRILEKLDRKNSVASDSKTVRTHPNIESSNYDNAFGGRKAYDVYKNQKGLYEPVTPSRGIKMEKKED